MPYTIRVVEITKIQLNNFYTKWDRFPLQQGEHVVTQYRVVKLQIGVYNLIL